MWCWQCGIGDLARSDKVGLATWQIGCDELVKRV